MDAVTKRAARTLFQVEKLRTTARASQGQLTIIQTKDDLRSFRKKRGLDSSLVGAMLGIEGLHALDDDFNNVRVFFDAGIRMMAATHFFDNKLGGSSAGRIKGGLTPFGADVIREMERLGVLIDLAHNSEELMDDILKIVTKPVVTSHTGVQAICPG